MGSLKGIAYLCGGGKNLSLVEKTEERKLGSGDCWHLPLGCYSWSSESPTFPSQLGLVAASAAPGATLSLSCYTSSRKKGLEEGQQEGHDWESSGPAPGADPSGAPKSSGTFLRPAPGTSRQQDTSGPRKLIMSGVMQRQEGCTVMPPP